MAELTDNASPPDCIFGNKAGENNGKSDDARSAGASPPNPCPQCGSTNLYRDGLRHLTDGSSTQRWLCRNCAYRFSEGPLQENQKWQINTEAALLYRRQICAKGAKNLTSATELKTVAGDAKKRSTFFVASNLTLISEEQRGLLTKFMAYLERQGYDAENQYPTTLSHLVKDGANLLDPENVKTVIAKQKKKNGEPWSNSMKLLASCAYDLFVKMQDLSWVRPTYTQNESTIYVPDEKELDLLISAARRRMATFLGLLKETFADPSEIAAAEWVDFKNNVFSINHPVKGHLPGKYELTPQLCSMINALHKRNKRIFPTTYKSLYNCFFWLRKGAAERFQNPALLNITFKSFRHWGGTYIAQISNGNPLIIMKMLRHKSFKSSLKYIHAVQFKDEDYDVTSATTPEEILALGKAGWTKYDELTIAGVAVHFFRKPKRFGGVKTVDDKSQKSVDKFLCSV